VTDTERVKISLQGCR